ncbi:MAG TPA: response regulator, partial [Candidatus Thermoplasmatota archaeon]|nr:response regulator [Candidatus Thermoplasmatota archaeon]
VVAAAAAKLLALLAGVDVGVDRVLFADGLAAYDPPNRMAPNTALNFVLLGMAVVLLEAPARRGVVASQALALASVAIALLVVIGYVYGVTQLQGWYAFLPMALHTALAFLLLAAGVLAVRAREGMMRYATAENVGGRLARRILPFALGLPILLGYLRIQGEHRGFYTTEFGVALFTIGMIVVFSAVIVTYARSAGVADEARRRAEEEAARSLERAIEATRAKSDFLANMSHEIRTPLNAVIGMTDLLMDTRLNDQQRDYASTIRASGEHLITIISDILDLSKVEAGKLELESRPVLLRDVVERAIDLLGPAASAKGLELVFDAAPTLPAAIATDEVRLRQVLVNLLSNAVKFTSRGEIVVRGSGRALDGGRVEALFEVRDEGIGIPPDRLARLFQPFTQGDASTTRTHGGTGLGLAISRRIVELMGGRIWAESVVGEGTTFRFTVVAPLAEAPPSLQLNLTPRLHGRRVLVVDDTPTNRRVVQEHLRSWGMMPEATASPTEALDWLRQGRPYDALVVDFHMPEMDGGVLAREAHRLRGRDLPIVLLSSMGTRSEGAEFAAVLTKPIKASTLFDALIGIFAREPGEAPPAAEDHPAAGPLSILLVEDNAVNQKVAALMLRRLGYEPDVATNGAEAVEKATTGSYDVVLMDIQMPEMDGLEATRRIRAACGDARPRIVALTAHALAGERERCLAAGMDDYLTKPLEQKKLREALARAGGAS